MPALQLPGSCCGWELQSTPLVETNRRLLTGLWKRLFNYAAGDD